MAVERAHISVAVRVLHDGAALWKHAATLLGDDIVLRDGPNGSADAIGIVTWRSASRSERAQLEQLRVIHDGPIVALLAEMPSPRGSRVLAARVEGSVLAEDLDRSLGPTLSAVAAGQCVVPRAVRQLVEHPALSARERQVLAMLVLNFSNAEIARKLVVTESNVKNHLTSAFAKLGVVSRNAAVALILDNESGLGPGILRISPED